jgi:hypothetical protein
VSKRVPKANVAKAKPSRGSVGVGVKSNKKNKRVLPHVVEVVGREKRKHYDESLAREQANKSAMSQGLLRSMTENHRRHNGNQASEHLGRDSEEEDEEDEDATTQGLRVLGKGKQKKRRVRDEEVEEDEDADLRGLGKGKQKKRRVEREVVVTQRKPKTLNRNREAQNDREGGSKKKSGGSSSDVQGKGKRVRESVAHAPHIGSREAQNDSEGGTKKRKTSGGSSRDVQGKGKMVRESVAHAPHIGHGGMARAERIGWGGHETEWLIRGFLAYAGQYQMWKKVLNDPFYSRHLGETRTGDKLSVKFGNLFKTNKLVSARVQVYFAEKARLQLIADAAIAALALPVVQAVHLEQQVENVDGNEEEEEEENSNDSEEDEDDDESHGGEEETIELDEEEEEDGFRV